MTISLGVAARIPVSGTSSRSLLEQADAALYRAKREGRNRVAAASAEDEEADASAGARPDLQLRTPPAE